MDQSEKDNLKQSLLGWLKDVNDEQILHELNEVQETYCTENYSAAQTQYIEERLENAEGDRKAGRLINRANLNQLPEKWRNQAS